MSGYEQVKLELWKQPRGLLMAKWSYGNHEHPTKKAANLKDLRDRHKELLMAHRDGHAATAKRVAARLGSRMMEVITEGCGEVVDELEEHLAQGGRLRMLLTLRDGDLEQLPWELLHLHHAGFLAEREGVSIVRTGQSPEPLVVSTYVQSPYSALLADSVEVAKEGRLLPKNTEHKTGLSWDGLALALVARPSVVALAGHGVAGSAREEPSILFPQRTREARPVSSTAVAEALEDMGVQVAIVTACSVGSDSGNAWAGMGAALVEAARIPAVISMQAPVRATEAGDFTVRLLELLAEGRTVDESLALARPVLGDEWWVPLLHSREAESFQLAAAPPTEPPSEVTVIRRSGAPESYPVLQPGAAEMGYWWSAPSGTRGTPVVRLSANGRTACFAAVDGTVQLGAVDEDGHVRWGQPASRLGTGETALTVYSPLFTTELAVSGPGPRTAVRSLLNQRVYDRDLSPVQAVSAAWTGNGFIWVTAEGAVDSEDESLAVLGVRRGSALLVDAVIHGQMTCIATWDGQQVTVVRYRADDDTSWDQRSMKVDGRIDRLVLARAHPDYDGTELGTVFVRQDTQLVGWWWHDLMSAP